MGLTATRDIHTQVVIIGAGPAGLFLQRILELEGIDSILLEAKSREYCEQRTRAGALEPAIVDLLLESGANRVAREGAVHEKFEVHYRSERHEFPVREITGKCLTIYPQQEVVKDLLALGDATQATRFFEVSDVKLDNLAGGRSEVSFTYEGHDYRVLTGIVAGCDGFHGVSRQSIPSESIRTFEAAQAAVWFGATVQAPPSVDHIVYGLSEEGFAMHSMRGPGLTRLYLQYRDSDPATNWSKDRFWEEMKSRLSTNSGWDQQRGDISDTINFSIRAFICEPMRFGNLFLAGDAAHIVPPTGAKGLNAAAWDSRLLAEAIVYAVKKQDERYLDLYSQTALRRDWRMLHFSHWMTELFSLRDPGDEMELQTKYTELDQLVVDGPMRTSFLQRYVGDFV